jgi:hypothetical protein
MMTTMQQKPGRSDEFAPVTGGGEQVDAFGLMVSAYVLMWVILFGFIFLTWKKQAALSTRLDELQKKSPGG